MKEEEIRGLASRYGTPLYSYDGEIIHRQYRLLRGCLPEAFDIFYSVKCNPLAGVCGLFRQWGARIEVASLGELHIALSAGFRPRDIVFTSPGKTRAELEAALDHGIYSINVESVAEAALAGELALARGETARIAVRIHPNSGMQGAGLKMAGVPTPFGIDQTGIDEAIAAISAMPGVALIGLHVFTGSQILDADVIVRGMRDTINLALELSERHGFGLQFLDLGGGFGVPYFAGETALDTDRLREGILELWEEYGARLAGTRIGVESGRFLMAESGVFLTKALYVKECKGAKFVVCDGGSNHHAASAFLGRYVRNNFPMHVLGKEGGPAVETNVVGCLCTPTDVIGQRVGLSADVEPEDIVVVSKSGAYGLTHSPTMFLSHALPAEVLVWEGEAHLLRERGKTEDAMRGQRMPAANPAFRDDYARTV
ncbi:type III PLP-dependent enzyme [Cohnella suwonensis]|uniref:Type III PLP-dependent enzyme n=1 Tax=Cohnella suwonensis TaxID=696072 RepID=A0ABW0LQI5_9BACL